MNTTNQMVKTRKIEKIGKMGYSVIPFLIVYLYLFFLGMDITPDRNFYIQMFEFPFTGREEIGIHLFAYLSGLLISNPKITFGLFQISYISIYLFVFYKVANGKAYKFYFLLCCLVTVFSNQTGIQVRIGAAMALFILIAYYKQPVLKNSLYYIVPVLFHYGTFPAIVLLYIANYLNINSYKKLLLCLVIGMIAITLIMNELPLLLDYLPVSDYYKGYFVVGSAVNQGRLIPFSFLFYCALLILLSCLNKKFNKDYNFFFIYLGLFFPFLAIFFNIYVSYKMLNVILLFAVVYLVKNISIENWLGDHIKIITILSYLLMNMGLIYYGFNTGVIA
ncbi:EpsG family protein [Lonepinella sp. BR2930]|uniref:EpsG family protein n=1 Tax=Lonepinella sp. BR2930 TaxID=3434554 RepID=UPI003F6E1741